MWLFACVALMLVALAAFGAGRLLERSRQSRALREARAQGQLLNQLLDVWQWQTDRHHRLLRLQPPAGASASAWAPGEWGGQPLWERFDGGADADAANALRAQLESMVSLGDVAVHPVGAPPDLHWLLRGTPRFDAEGQFEGYIGTARAGGAAPEALVATPHLGVPQTDHGELLSEQAAFSYTVTHDLRAPIRVVEGFARILKEDYGRVLDRIGNDHLDRVLAAAARMNSMIDALLTLANLSAQPLARQPVNLSQLAGFVVDDLRRSSAERHVEVEVAPGMVADGDPDAAAPGAGEPARQCLEVQRAQPAGQAAIQLRHPRGPAGLQRLRQRRWLRHAQCRPAVRRVPAPAQRQRLPGHRRRAGVGEAHRAPPWRRHLGGIRTRQRCALSVHLETMTRRGAAADDQGAPGRASSSTARTRRSACSCKGTLAAAAMRCSRPRASPRDSE